MDTLFDGKAAAEEIFLELTKKRDQLESRPGLALVSFGPQETVFVRRKKEIAERLGILCKHYSFDESIASKEFRRRLNNIVRLPAITSIVVQLPLPLSINSRSLNVIPSEKDPDFLSDRAVGRFFNNNSRITPPTASAVVHALEKSGIGLSKKTASIFGYGTLVGRFLVKTLLEKGVQVKVTAEELTKEETKAFVADSDIVVSAVGKPHFLDSRLLPEGAVVIDAGFSTLDGRVVGDIHFDTHDRFRFISPVPGGIGPVGIAMLFQNIITLHNISTKRTSV